MSREVCKHGTIISSTCDECEKETKDMSEEKEWKCRFCGHNKEWFDRSCDAEGNMDGYRCELCGKKDQEDDGLQRECPSCKSLESRLKEADERIASLLSENHNKGEDDDEEKGILGKLRLGF